MVLSEAGQVPPAAIRAGLIPDGSTAFINAMHKNREHWLSPERRMGIIRTAREAPHGDTFFTGFLMGAKRAARDVAGLPGTTPGQLVAAMPRGSAK
jgi:hypothetical protein